MSKSLVAHIPSYKKIAVAVLLATAGNAFSQNAVLTEEDIALIEQGRSISKRHQSSIYRCPCRIGT